MARKICGPIFIGLLLLYFITLVLHISANFNDYQWDLRTHREAGKIFASGANPYDPVILFPKAATRFLYTYPPATLFFYRLLAMTDYRTAFHFFLIAKGILLIGLVYFWKREFLKENADPFFYLFCLLAFNSAVFLDLIAGNINLIEQVLLWLAFGFYLRHRLVLFCVFVLIAAGFKMTPIFFLVLLLLSDDQKKYQYLLVAAGAFLAYLLVQYVIVPDLFVQFVRNALTVVGERGDVVPATYKLLADVFTALAQVSGTVVPRSFQLTLVVIAAAVVIYQTYRAHSRLKRSDMADRDMVSVFLVCLVYALILPRFKDYAYILLLVPSYYIIKNIRYTKAAPFLFVLFILSGNPTVFVLPVASSLYAFIWKYYPLMVAYCVWGLYLHEIFSLKRLPENATPSGKKPDNRSRQL